MNFTKLPFSAVLLALSVIAISHVNAQEDPGTCKGVGFTLGKPSCPRGMSEIYMEFAREADQTHKWCCTTGSEQEKVQRRYAATCRATKCMRSTASDACGTLYERYVNGKKMDYEEVMRDTCTLKNGGGAGGIVGLCCPRNSTEGYLVTTYGAESNEFPHQAKLKIGNGNCGGTIYNKNHIVTASHCIVSDVTKLPQDPKTITAILGTNNADMEGDEYVYKVKKVIHHEQYSSLKGQPDEVKGGHMHFNDVALLELERDITFSDKIKALEIAPKGFDPFKYADNAVIVGWGTMENQAISVNLQKANFLLRSDDTCFQYTNEAPYPHYHEYEKQLLCVGGIRDGKWSPTAGGGDSGGPAICRAADGKIVLCGVTSFGADDEKCGRYNDQEHCKSSVYAEVAYFHDWIVKRGGPQDPKTFYKPYLYGEPVSSDHHVRITSDGGNKKTACGGTLIAPDIVVTAAQCIMSGDGKTSHRNVQITHGLQDLTKGGSGTTYGIKGAARHQNFGQRKKEVNVEEQGNHVILVDNYYKDDLAVIKLDRKVPVDPSQLPILPDFRDKFYQGIEIAFPRNTTISGELRKRNFQLLELSECQRRMDRLSTVTTDAEVDSNLMCGVEKYSGGSQCDRELGGGLICQKGNQNVLCGIQVFRMCEYTIPNGFLNMATFSSWVNSAIKQLSK